MCLTAPMCVAGGADSGCNLRNNSSQALPQILNRFLIMAAIRLESPWFRSYSRALLTDDPVARRVYVKTALVAMHETLRLPGIQEDEQQAISAAIRELNSLDRDSSSAKAS
jgi:hypothetical protein